VKVNLLFFTSSGERAEAIASFTFLSPTISTLNVAKRTFEIVIRGELLFLRVGNRNS